MFEWSIKSYVCTLRKKCLVSVTIFAYYCDYCCYDVSKNIYPIYYISNIFLKTDIYIYIDNRKWSWIVVASNYSYKSYVSV